MAAGVSSAIDCEDHMAPAYEKGPTPLQQEPAAPAEAASSLMRISLASTRSSCSAGRGSTRSTGSTKGDEMALTKNNLRRRSSSAPLLDTHSDESDPGAKQIWQRVTSKLTRVNDAMRLMRRAQIDDTMGTTFSEQQMTRVSMRLEGMESYSVLGALISGFSLQLVSSITMADFDGLFCSFFAAWFILLGTLTIVAALYATIIFALVSLHGKACVGMNMDDAYLNYITQTASHRETGFVALLSCFVGIVATLMCMLFMRTPTFTASLVCFVSACVSWIAARRVKDIMHLASCLIFS